MPVVVDNVKAPEQYLHNINGDYSIIFDVVDIPAGVALEEGTELEFGVGGDPVEIILQDGPLVFGTKQRTVSDYDNLISAAIPAVEAQDAVYGEKQGEYDVDLGYAPMVPDYDNVISPAVEAQAAVPAVYGTKVVTVPDYDTVITYAVIEGVKYGLKEEQAEDTFVILVPAVEYSPAVPEVPPTYGESEQYNLDSGMVEMMPDTSIILSPGSPAIPEQLAVPAVYGVQTIKVTDLTSPFLPEFTYPAGGWQVKQPNSTATKLGYLAEPVAASVEAQKVKAAIRSNTFNLAV